MSFGNKKTIENILDDKVVLDALRFGMTDFLDENIGRASNAETSRERRQVEKTLDSYIDTQLKIEGFSWYQRVTKGREIKAHAKELLDLITTNYDNAIHSVLTAETAGSRNQAIQGLLFNSMFELYDQKKKAVKLQEKAAVDRAKMTVLIAKKKEEIVPWYARAAQWAAAPVTALTVWLAGSSCGGSTDQADHNISTPLVVDAKDYSPMGAEGHLDKIVNPKPAPAEAPRPRETVLPEQDIPINKYESLYNQIVASYKGKASITKQDALMWFRRQALDEKKGLYSKTTWGKAYEWAQKNHGINLDRIALNVGFNEQGVWRRYTPFSVEDLGDTVPSRLWAMARDAGCLRQPVVADKQPSKPEVAVKQNTDGAPVKMTPPKISHPEPKLGSIVPDTGTKVLRPTPDPERGRITEPKPEPPRPEPKPEPRTSQPKREVYLESFVRKVETDRKVLEINYNSIMDDLAYIVGTPESRKLYGTSLVDIIQEKCGLQSDGKGGYVKKDRKLTPLCVYSVDAAIKYMDRVTSAMDLLIKQANRYAQDASYLQKNGRQVKQTINVHEKMLRLLKEQLYRQRTIIKSYGNTSRSLSDLRKLYGNELDAVVDAYQLPSRTEMRNEQRDSRMFQVRDLYEQGLSLNNIARRVGASKSTVKRDLKKARDMPYLEMKLAA